MASFEYRINGVEYELTHLHEHNYQIECDVLGAINVHELFHNDVRIMQHICPPLRKFHFRLHCEKYQHKIGFLGQNNELINDLRDRGFEITRVPPYRNLKVKGDAVHLSDYFDEFEADKSQIQRVNILSSPYSTNDALMFGEACGRDETCNIVYFGGQFDPAMLMANIYCSSMPELLFALGDYDLS